MNLAEACAVLRDSSDLTVRPPVKIGESDEGAPQGYANIPLSVLADAGADLSNLPDS